MRFLKKENLMTLLAASSIILQFILIILVALKFTKDIFIIIFILLVYNIILNFSTEYIKSEPFGLLYREFNHLLFFVLNFFVLITNIYGWVTNNCTVLNIVNLILQILNFYVHGFKLYKYVDALNLVILALMLSIISFNGVNLGFYTKLLVMSATCIIMFSISYFFSNRVMHKIVAYFAVNFFILSALALHDGLQFFKYIPLISSSIEMIFELLTKSRNARHYVAISFIVAFLLINISLVLLDFFILLLSIFVYSNYVKINEMNNVFEIFPLVALMPSIYSSNLFVNSANNDNLAIMFSLVIIIYTALMSAKKKKFCLETLITIICIIESIIAFKLNLYASISLILILAFSHMVTFSKNTIYKIIVYVCILIMYNALITDFAINQYIFIRLISFIVFIYIMTRTIIKKYGTIYRVIEYLGLICIYLFAYYNYLSIADAITFIGMLIFMTAIGYKTKVGSLFAVSTFFIIINFVQLTIDFWRSLSWWHYVLTALAIFFVSSILNEAYNNVVSDKIKKIIKNIKNVLNS